MPEILTTVAALFTIWAQSSILAENGEFERFKEPQESILQERYQNHQDEYNRRREEILTAALERKTYILSQTKLGE